MTFKEFLILEVDMSEPMVVDPTFVERNPRLVQARKSATSPTGNERFQKMYRREVLRDTDQRKKQKMLQRTAAKYSTDKSEQEPSATL